MVYYKLLTMRHHTQNSIAKTTAEWIINHITHEGELRPYDIQKKLHISNVVVHKQLRKLVNKGIIKKKGKPPLVTYVLADMPDPTLEQLKQKALPILKKAHVKRAAFFGSYVRGEQKPSSDVDILVDLPDN